MLRAGDLRLEKGTTSYADLHCSTWAGSQIGDIVPCWEAREGRERASSPLAESPQNWKAPLVGTFELKRKAHGRAVRRGGDCGWR